MEGRSIRSSFRPQSPSVAWVLWLVAALTLAGAAQGVSAPEIRIEPTTLYFGAASAGAAVSPVRGELAPSFRPVVAPELREKAAKDGGARVLVRLATAFTPEGSLDSARAAGQRNAIRQTQDATLRKLAGAKVKVHALYEHIPFLALEVDAAALDLLSHLPEVAGIQEDVFERPSLASSTAVIGAGVAWSGGQTGAGKTIAILDTGVDKTHPFFSSGGHNKVVSEACYSSVLPNSSVTSLCPGGVQESTSPGSGVNCPVGTSADCQHGTHVAGIAAGNDGVGPNFGVARDADLIAIQVYSLQYGYSLGAWVSDQIKGLERVYALAGQFDIAAVNMSLGGYPYYNQASCDADNAARKAAIDNLRSIDIATVASSGNNYDFGVSAPACISSAISVGATDDGDAVAPFSNIASFLSLVAPGVAINSSVPGGGIASFNGTSMASPHVAGSWAVLKQTRPTATVSDVLAVLRGTATSVGGFGFDLRRINLGKAVSAGPLVTQDFTIYNDGAAVLSVLSMQLETLVPWIRWSLEAPFDVAPGGSRRVAVSVDFNALPSGTSMNRLIVSSTDADENPYPNAVHLVMGKEACYPLTRTRTGNGGNPEATPSTSPGCPAGQFHAGASLLLTSRPATGWALQSWSGTGNDVSTAATNSLTMPAAPHTVSVTYYALCFTLTRSHTGSGTDPVAAPTNSPGCPAGQYKYAEPIQLTAVPASGWRVGSWTNTSRDTSFSKTNSLVMPASALTVSVAYLEGLASLLLVDNDSDFYDYRSFYTAALDSLGVLYQVWDVAVNGRPSAADLATYPKVAWYGYRYSTPIDAADEAVLATYLDQGGRLFLAAQDYLDYQGLTPFAASYLGVGSYIANIGPITVQGQGTAFSGLGPFELDYPAYYYGNGVSPAPGAEVAFHASEVDYYSNPGPVGVSKVGSNYRTIFLGFQFESLPTVQARYDVMAAALEFLSTVFVDVPRGYWAKKWIEALYYKGVTTGCSSSPRQYCPESPMTRGLMASFLLLSKEPAGYVPPPCTTAPFNDIPSSSPLCPWVQELVRRGVTSGCGGGNYCPDSVVTRNQMAVFLLSTLEGPGYAPPACSASSSLFVDVPSSSPFCPWVGELARRGVTGGCGGGNYCPGDQVNRAQMAVFLTTMFHLPVF